ncbi:MAG: 6-bladed beta-propeller, partial [Bacteroidales bacterium]|nr:6-bladed beta-propeller [Bacteroidales bacterium]
MKKKAIACLFLVAAMVSCSPSNKNQPNGLIRIDVLDAFRQQKSMKLSDVVKDVELVPFEISKEAYFSGFNSYAVGKKFILIADGGRNRVVLFNRSGKFIREIGRKGKGPGEFNDPRSVAMDPQEEYVFMADWTIGRLLKYTIDGKLVKSVSTAAIPRWCAIDDIRFINDDCFVLVLHRPVRPVDGYSSLALFNKNLELVQKILPRANDENLCFCVNPNGVFGSSESRMTFWEPLLDTLYTITPEGKSFPTHQIGFSKGGPTREFAKNNFNPNLSAENVVKSILEFGGYIQIRGESKR